MPQLESPVRLVTANGESVEVSGEEELAKLAPAVDDIRKRRQGAPKGSGDGKPIPVVATSRDPTE
jgi:hypothetical protein